MWLIEQEQDEVLEGQLVSRVTQRYLAESQEPAEIAEAANAQSLQALACASGLRKTAEITSHVEVFSAAIRFARLV